MIFFKNKEQFYSKIKFTWKVSIFTGFINNITIKIWISYAHCKLNSIGKVKHQNQLFLSKF